MEITDDVKRSNEIILTQMRAVKQGKDYYTKNVKKHTDCPNCTMRTINTPDGPKDIYECDRTGNIIPKATRQICELSPLLRGDRHEQRL